LQYDIYFNDDQSECIVQERYRDSEALIEHAGHLGDLNDAILATGFVSGALLGEPSAELRAQMARQRGPSLHALPVDVDTARRLVRAEERQTTRTRPCPLVAASSSRSSDDHTGVRTKGIPGFDRLAAAHDPGSGERNRGAPDEQAGHDD